MKKIVCLGDSLTEGTDVDKNYTWPALVANELRVEVLNRGIGGDTTGGLLGRFYFDVAQQRPDIVLIMGGTNDLWWDLDLNSIQANIFTMACQARYHQIAPVIGIPPPLFMPAVQTQDMLGPVAGFERCLQKLNHLASILMHSAQTSDIPCIDFYHLFLDRQGEVIGAYFLEDGLHPNKAGHRAMAARIVATLRNLFYPNMQNAAD
ncbi:MAG: hypothetical protein JSW39_23165 [Desulfobacterales bacterium]|nr:MAG: hypothetical protein JSW39_23165 [Desulfobacterales bacterium]